MGLRYSANATTLAPFLWEKRISLSQPSSCAILPKYNMAQPDFGPCPPRFADIKRQIAASYPDFEERATRAWADILAELDKATTDIARQGSEVTSPNTCLSRNRPS